MSRRFMSSHLFLSLDMMRNWLNLTIYIHGTVDFSYFKDIPTSAQLVSRSNCGDGCTSERDLNSTMLIIYNHISYGCYGDYSAEVRLPLQYTRVWYVMNESGRANMYYFTIGDTTQGLPSPRIAEESAC